MKRIASLSGLEILDSRGHPTVKCLCILNDGVEASASVPSGASTGRAEAIELRDGDPRRFGGLGCLKAVSHVNGLLAEELQGKSFDSQEVLDNRLIELDGTLDKSRLGSNSLLAVSMAYARCASLSEGKPLHLYFSEMLDVNPKMPRLTVNLFSGGKHAGDQVAIQDVLLVPCQASVSDSLAAVFTVYQTAARVIMQRHGMPALSADEGGLAPPFTGSEAMLEEACYSIQAAGLELGGEMELALDAAASHFYAKGRYDLDGKSLSSTEMIVTLKNWSARFPLISIEDGLHEEDWEHWPMLKQELGEACLTLGDDLLCTSSKRIRRATSIKACNALLLKLNQIGTLSEGAEAYRIARDAGWKVVVSARSGETEDDWLADLAYGWGADYIKVGSITQSERLAKYNRLIEIEASVES